MVSSSELELAQNYVALAHTQQVRKRKELERAHDLVSQLEVELQEADTEYQRATISLQRVEQRLEVVELDLLPDDGDDTCMDESSPISSTSGSGTRRDRRLADHDPALPAPLLREQQQNTSDILYHQEVHGFSSRIQEPTNKSLFRSRPCRHHHHHHVRRYYCRRGRNKRDRDEGCRRSYERTAARNRNNEDTHHISAVISTEGDERGSAGLDDKSSIMDGSKKNKTHQKSEKNPSQEETRTTNSSSWYRLFFPA